MAIVGASPLASQPPITIADLVARLLDRLDINEAYWTAVECRLYVIEALRVFNAMSNYFKTSIAITITPGQLFYDLTSSDTFPTPPLTYTVTDTQMVREIEFHLLEPPTINVWTGSSQFTMDDVLQAIYARRDQFLLDTGCVITRYQQDITGPPAERTPLSDSVIDIRRAAFLDLDETFHQLWREDEATLNYFTPAAPQNPTVPRAYSITAEPPYEIRLSPPPSNSGTLDLLIVAQAPPAITFQTPQNQVLGIPDDYAWGVKYGALADLFNKKGEGRDPARAEYCEMRYMEAVAVTKLITTVISGRLNNIQIKLDALDDLDTFFPNWHNTLGTPNTVVMAGWNMLLPDRAPDQEYGVSMDIVGSAPVTDDTANLGISGSMTDAILDYAQHIATLKEAGDEFTVTMKQYENLKRIGMLNNQRLRASGIFADDLMQVAQKEEKKRKRVA